MPGKNITQRDGFKCSQQRDPPGQFTRYIPPGDPWKESYRAVTYRNFPQDTPICPRNLADSGFYYTGYKDRVKCFSCATSIENWIVGDDPKEKKWHRDDCDFANGRDRTNEPILGIYKRYLAASPTVRQRNSSTNGRSTMMSGRDNAQQQIATNIHSGATNAASHGTENARNHSPGTGEAQTSAVTQSPMDVDYPCLYPVNPHMRSPVARLETFKPTPRVRWPRERLRAGINEITNAGFFYLGERDRVKCWYCNGGLQNWDYDDDPWTEHAKWFPSCEFLLRVKGAQFVQNIVDQYPNINRPTPTVRIVRRQGNNPPPPPSTSNPQQSLTTEEIIENAMRNHSYVSQVKDMGFSEDAIKAVLTRKQNSDGRLFDSVDEFVEALSSYQRHSHPQPQRRNSISAQDTSLTQRTQDSAAEQASNSSMLSELRSMEQSRLCKICQREPSNVVLVPCGHLACCSNCSTAELRRCPVCNRGIQEKIRAFRS